LRHETKRGEAILRKSSLLRPTSDLRNDPRKNAEFFAFAR
jgi:hypothetical protein